MTVTVSEYTADAAEAGLTSPQAAALLRQYGPNAVAEARPHRIALLLRKFWGVIPWMLELAVIIDLILHRWVEAGVIAALLVFNATVSFLHEGRAQRALALLRQRLTVNARVRRDGRWQTLAADGIVPGDLVHLRAGDIVPADVRLADGILSVDQSVLTGESLPVESRAGSTAYSGALVRRGEATGVVTATGARTYFGKTAELVRAASAPPRTERLILKIARYLGALVMVLAIGACIAMLVQRTPLAEMLPFGLLLLMSSVPVALPAMFTLSSALGARALADEGILVTRLSAIEDAASMDVLCLDKTGTVTENRLTVEKLEPRAGLAADEALRLAALASDESTQDPIDLAILKAARERGLDVASASRASFVPFDPDTKRSEASVRQDDRLLRVIKGAPATVAELAGLAWDTIAEDVARLAADGARVLAVASGADSGLQLAGLIALADPPRADSAALIAELQKRGVRVLLVTGDGEATARAIAAKVGITGEVAPAGTIRDDLDPQAFARFAVFAHVFPQDKFFLVRALQRAGHVVGMTGDGVNDAPALKQADVGIAVASATDVAKAAASLVLTRPGLAEIVAAIEGSRRIFQRMRTFVLTMTARKLSTPTFMSLGVIVLGVFVLNPVLIVLLAFTRDFATTSISTDRVLPSPEPDRWDVRALAWAGLGLGVLLLASSGAIYWLAAHVLNLTLAEIQTAIFLWLTVNDGQATIYLNRARRHFWNPPYPGRWVAAATLLVVGAASLMAIQGWLMAPLPPSLVGAMLLLAVAFLFIADQLKFALARLAARRSGAGRGVNRAGEN
jgi:H+-transporting ATPase